MTRSRILAFLLISFVSLLSFSGLRAEDPCITPNNEIVAENCITGNPASQWDITGAGDLSIQGFATEMSVDQGETISFKIDTPATDYRLDIYRLGYYGGAGARLIATVQPSASLPQPQPACLNDAATGLIDCGNWAVSASWTVPTTAVSGVYLAHAVREDVASQGSHIVFIVRDDDGGSAMLFQTADTTWQAYNQFGGNSLYVGSPAGRAYMVSYNRPFTTRAYAAEDWLFNAEYPMIRWLEANGYDVSYTTGIDTDRRGAELLEHQIFLSVGHDEYWSAAQRANVETARGAGVHLAFFSSNEIFWKTRWLPSIDGSSTPYRTLVSYKETHAGAKIDPEPTIWTGTWRDPRPFNPEGPQPENALTGQIFTVNCCTYAMTVPAEDGRMRFWRNTDIATLAPGTSATLPNGILGYEWDEALDNGSRPAGLFAMSTTTVNVPQRIIDNGSNYAPSTATHNLVMYRHSSGALVFGSGTLQWSWGLDSTHDREFMPTDLRVQQATVNLFADMNVQPASLRAGLTPATASTDFTAPTAAINPPGEGALIQTGVPFLISGTATDTGGGVVGGVEISTDNGLTWWRASGRESWSYLWTPPAVGVYTLLARAVDDSGNLGAASAPQLVNVDTRTCPCSVWNDSIIPGIASQNDSGAVELGMRFQVTADGFLTAIRFYKGLQNTGLHTGRLWSPGGALLAEVTFMGETASGWQQQALSSPLPVTAGSTYIVSYHAPNGRYAFSEGFFSSSGVNSDPLIALQSVSGALNGVYHYGPGGIFPANSYNDSNYWVDVVFETTVGPDTTPPTVLNRTPSGSSVSIGTNVTVTFNEALDAATINAATFELRGPDNLPLPASISYNAATRTATLAPQNALAFATTYTAVVKGGAGGVTDDDGNALALDYTWQFSTGGAPPAEGPGGPLLVAYSATNSFGRYYAEILRAEGLNLFSTAEISTLSAPLLNNYSVLILAETPLSPAQVTLISDWVNAGGNLIAMRPDAQLDTLLGLTSTGGALSEGYLQVAGIDAGAGIVTQTMQYHGTASVYTLNGATSLATLYSTANAATASPAVTIRSVGSSGGQAAMFAFDLARSVVYTRQGNPAWAGQERDGVSPIRSNDLFYGAAAGDPQPDWIDLNRVAIPQADEQQRLLANMIVTMNLDRMPLPRFWYLPRGERAAVVMTGDDHNSGGTVGQFSNYVNASPAGCSVDDWECVRSTSYVYIPNSIAPAQALSYNALGFEIGLHVNTGCADWTTATLPGFYTTQLADFRAFFGALPDPTTNRTHCIAWSDWATQAQVQLDNGIRFDTNYYYWPPNWVNNRPGFFTGSGMPMRFANLDGSMIDVYQAVTQITDESGQDIPFTIQTLLNRALGAEGYYAVITTNMHTDQSNHLGGNAIVAEAIARGVPVVSARQMLAWLDGRNASSFNTLSWSDGVLTFTVSAAAGSNGIQAMIPNNAPVGPLTGITRNGTPIAFTVQTIKGVSYAAFDAPAGAYVATYAIDNTPPLISNVLAAPQVGGSAIITWQTNETATSTVVFGTDANTLNGTQGSSALVGNHSVTLTGLTPGATYYFRVLSADSANNSATFPNPPAAPLSFVLPSAALVDTTTSDFAAGTGACTVATLAGNGEVFLTPTVFNEFNGTALPGGWTARPTPWTLGGAITVGGGLLSADGSAAAYTTTTFDNNGYTLEFVATFQAAPYQHVGFVGDFDFDQNWIIFSTGASGTELIARTNINGSNTETPLGSSYLGAPHRFSIARTPTSIVYAIDGTLVATHSIAMAQPLYIMASDYNAGGPSVSVDWARLLPYTSPCTFTSRILDAGAPADWQTITWTSLEPANTAIAMSVRTGDTSTPDGSWSAFAPVTNGATIGLTARYIQYQAVLSSSDRDATPVLQEVSFGYQPGPDTYPPQLIERSPQPNATDVALNSSVSARFDEALNPATVNSASFRLRQQGAGSDVPAAITYDSLTNTITLDPTADLTPGGVYTVTIAASVADANNNALGAPITWSFTTALGGLVDTTVANFIAGTGDCLVAQISGDGEITLWPQILNDFSGAELDGGWAANGLPWTPGGAATVSGGQLSVNGISAGYLAASYASGYTLEFVATFGADSYQHAGFVDSLNFGGPWAMFSTLGTTTNLYARTSGAGDTLIPGSWLGTPHRFSITRTASSVVYAIDGTVVMTHNVALPTALYLVVSDYNVNGISLNIDWMRLLPYNSPCTFTSRILDAGQIADWGNIAWVADVPNDTNLIVSVRTGDTSTPDGSWSAFAPVTNGAEIATNSRYIQYRAELQYKNDNNLLTPTLASVSFSYGLPPLNEAPLVTNPGDQNSAEGAAITLPIVASDPNGDTLTFSIIGLPPNLTFSTTTGEITSEIDYSAAAFSPYTVQVTASDGLLATTISFTWNVTNTNRAPLVEAIGGQADAEGNPVSLLISASDPDGDTLTFAATGLPDGLSINATTGEISGTLSFTAAGTYSVEVTVTDNGTPAPLATTISFTWNVSSTNRAPLVTN
ncbi:MAG: DUF4082 domain-containing protein, partial [Chloroflexi bacterium]|nr:DUF4082 domain-containing protein [Chloroflexota bacterium]